MGNSEGRLSGFMADRQVKNGMIRRFRRPENVKCAVSANCKRKASFQTTPNSHKPSANKNSLDAISRLFCYVETSEYLSDSRIRPTFSDDPSLRSSEKIETPDEWGESSDVQTILEWKILWVLIPDSWGKSLPTYRISGYGHCQKVLIPD